MLRAREILCNCSIVVLIGQNVGRRGDEAPRFSQSTPWVSGAQPLSNNLKIMQPAPLRRTDHSLEVCDEFKNVKPWMACIIRDGTDNYFALRNRLGLHLFLIESLAHY